MRGAVCVADSTGLRCSGVPTREIITTALIITSHLTGACDGESEQYASQSGTGQTAGSGGAAGTASDAGSNGLDHAGDAGAQGYVYCGTAPVTPPAPECEGTIAFADLALEEVVLWLTQGSNPVPSLVSGRRSESA